MIEVKKGSAIQVKVEHATSELLGYGIVHTNPEILQHTIIGSKAPDGLGLMHLIQDMAAFEAGPSDQIRWARYQYFYCTVKLGIKELLNKEQIGFRDPFTDYQLFYTINLLLNKELLPI